MTNKIHLAGIAILATTFVQIGCSGHPRPDSSFYRTFSEYEQRDIRNELASGGTLTKACDGDPDAVSQIFTCAEGYGREGGEKGEACSIRILVMMFYLGDVRFSNLLSSETESTREAVGERIDWAFEKSDLAFPATRGIYEYRAKNQQ